MAEYTLTLETNYDYADLTTAITKSWTGKAPITPSPEKTGIQCLLVAYRRYNSLVERTSTLEKYENYKLIMKDGTDLPADLNSEYVTFVFNEESKKALCEYIRRQQKRSIMDFDITLCGYNTTEEKWVEIITLDTAICPDNIRSKGNYFSASLKRGFTSEFENPISEGILSGYVNYFFVTRYSYPITTWEATVDWVTTKFKVSPQSGWKDTDAVEYSINYEGTNSIDLSGTFTQPAPFTDSMVGTSVIGDSPQISDIALGLTAKDNCDRTNTINFPATIFKYTPLSVVGYESYRCTSTGKQSLNGDYLAIWLDLDFNPMHYYNRTNGTITSLNTTANPLTLQINIKKLLTSEEVYNQSFTITTVSETSKAVNQKVEDWQNYKWVGKEAFVFDAETSYFLTITIADGFSSKTVSVNIGTKPAYIEWGTTGTNMAIGKYVETNGLEFQWDTLFHRSCIFLAGDGVEKVGDAAAAIPYTDTYSIGAANVQEALNWIFGRIS